MTFLQSRISRRFRSPAIIAFSLVLSASLYSLATPVLQPFLGAVARPIVSVPWQLVVLLRTAEVYISSYTSQTLNEIALAVFMSRIPTLHLFYASFSVPAHALLLISAIDVVSVFIPFWLIKRVRCLNSSKDNLLSTLYAALSATVLSIAIYIGSKTWYPNFILGHFSGIRSAVPIPLPLLVVGLFPAGWAFQEILAVRGPKGLASLLAQVMILATGNIWLSIRDADIWGAIGISGAWALLILIATAVLKWVGI